MKTTLQIVVLFALAALCGCAGRHREGGIIEVVGPARVDFGAYPAWERRVAEYRIRNAGDEPLGVVRIRETCEDCAHVSCTRKRLMPGEDALIRIEVLPDSLAGEYEKAACVECTNSSARFVPLLFAGNAIPIVEVKPADYVYMGRIKTNEEWRRSFQLTATTNGVRLGEPVMQSGNRAGITFERDCDKAGHCGELIVTVFPAAEPGDFCCTVKVPVLAPEGHPPIAISVAGKIGPELVAIPGLLCLAFSEAPVEKRFQLKILGGDDLPIDINSMELPACEGVEFHALPSSTADGGITMMARFNPCFIARLRSKKTITLNIGLPAVAPARLVCEGLAGRQKVPCARQL